MDYSKLDGLIPAVIQDAETSEVLMVGFMNDVALAVGPPRLGGGRRREQAIDLRVGDAVVPAARDARAHAAFVDPVLQRRVADAEPRGRLPDGEECHGQYR